MIFIWLHTGLNWAMVLSYSYVEYSSIVKIFRALSMLGRWKVCFCVTIAPNSDNAAVLNYSKLPKHIALAPNYPRFTWSLLFHLPATKPGPSRSPHIAASAKDPSRSGDGLAHSDSSTPTTQPQLLRLNIPACSKQSPSSTARAMGNQPSKPVPAPQRTALLYPAAGAMLVVGAAGVFYRWLSIPPRITVYVPPVKVPFDLGV